MGLTERINEDIKAAMKAKEKEKLAALRDIKSKLLLEATSGSGGTIDEATENKIIMKLHKQRMDTHAIYVEQNRQDLADDELFQAKIIEEYMPKMMSESEIEEVAKKTIEQVQASEMKDLGKVMGVLSKELAGKADGKLISQIVKKLLS